MMSDRTEAFLKANKLGDYAPKPKRVLYASAPTLAAIGEAITKFYCGCAKNLEPKGDGVWRVMNKGGHPMHGLEVRLVKGRYRFQSAD